MIKIYKKIHTLHANFKITLKKTELYLNYKEIKFRIMSEIRYLIRFLSKKHTLDKKLIISLTSYPPRFCTLQYTIKTLMSQSITPDKIVLWIYEKDIKLLPNNVKLLTNDIFQISKIDRDIKSYKKLIPSLYEYPDDFIVTADDDSYYSRNWLQELIQNYNPYKKEILGHRGHEITVDNNNKILPYNKWKKTIKTNLSSKYIILNGLGGILYPPHSLHQDVFKEHIFMDACPTTDDIWFYFMARKNNYVCKKISKEFKTYTWREARKNSLYNINVKRNINDESISKIVRIFGSPF